MRPPLPTTLALLLAAVLPTSAADDSEGLRQFTDWASRSLHPVATPGQGAVDLRDLAPLQKMIGSARVVAVSEAGHDGAEPLLFRNRLLEYLVEELGFTAIAIESWVTEGQLVHDYAWAVREISNRL
jgi:erythromycin esterase